MRYRVSFLKVSLVAAAALLVPGLAMTVPAGAAGSAKLGLGEPLSASGCDGDVCIYLQTSSPLITD